MQYGVAKIEWFKDEYGRDEFKVVEGSHGWAHEDYANAEYRAQEKTLALPVEDKDKYEYIVVSFKTRRGVSNFY